ncbi:hypothetical protein LTR36_005510 [Oleoguttula mirabilis]|uniref:Transmembrane protein n=1 Tax=Oleoguttula mirabilis TaxID=1507867 RepID=A0AAV9JDW1_9PEZI|nr:hypothetical protein LTR36_005510 [Oleoguttula mirabilis]
MPPRARRLSAIQAPAPPAAVSPAFATAPTHPSTLPRRDPLETDFDYASRLHATELLRDAHNDETSALRSRQDKQIAELEVLVAALSEKQKAILLRRYEDLASRQVHELRERLVWERFCRRVGVWVGMAVVLALLGVLWVVVHGDDRFRF